MSLLSTCALSVAMLVVVHVGVRLLWALIERLGVSNSLFLAAMALLLWPTLSRANAPLFASIDIDAHLDALREIAAEEPVVDVEQCVDEEMVTCYHQRKDQYADQMNRVLGVLESMQQGL